MKELRVSGITNTEMTPIISLIIWELHMFVTFNWLLVSLSSLWHNLQMDKAKMKKMKKIITTMLPCQLLNDLSCWGIHFHSFNMLTQYYCDNHVLQWWVEFNDELSWLFTNRSSATRYMKVKRMEITEILRRLWLFSANKTINSESLSKQPTQLIFELNLTLWHIIVTKYCNKLLVRQSF